MHPAVGNIQSSIMVDTVANQTIVTSLTTVRHVHVGKEKCAAMTLTDTVANVPMGPVMMHPAQPVTFVLIVQAIHILIVNLTGVPEIHVLTTKSVTAILILPSGLMHHIANLIIVDPIRTRPGRQTTMR